MEKLQLREAEIFKTLKKLENTEFVLIGGYAVNSYALPRFSVDCDIVIRADDVKEIRKTLETEGYKLAEKGNTLPYAGEFLRFEKTIQENISASVDVLINSVHDRQSGVTFEAEWIFANSKRRNIIGRTITEKIFARIINAEALFVMKFICARTTDIRDVFMMVPNIKDMEWIKEEISKRTNLKNQYEKVIKKITENSFRDNLHGVYGYLDQEVFKRNESILKKLG